MGKIKIYEIAKKLNLTSKEVLDIAQGLKIDAKSHLSAIDEEDAKRMLRMLSGKKHIVLSGYTIINKKYEISKTIKSIVYFNELNEEQIEEYIDKFKPLDKAGAYGIQDDYPLIHHIEGSYYNVMGLPIEDIERALKLISL